MGDSPEEGEVTEQPSLSPQTKTPNDHSNIKRSRPLPDNFPKPYKRCKYFSEGRCFKGKDCTFLHDSLPVTKPTKDDLVKVVPSFLQRPRDGVGNRLMPCRMLHGTGMCEKGEHCDFSHERLGLEQIQKFMEDNEPFLREIHEKKGTTNLGDYFVQYLGKKEQQSRNYDVSATYRRPPPPPLSPRKQLSTRLQRAGIIRKAELPLIDFQRLKEVQTWDETACYGFPL